MSWSLLLDLLTILSISVGLFFFLAGTVGLLRFPDTLCRLHALTKADNLGLGLLLLGLVIQQTSVADVLKMMLIWGLVLITSATCCFMIAGRVQEKPGYEGEDI